MKHNYNVLSSIESISAPMPCISQLVQDKINELELQEADHSFCICDVGDIIRKHKQWVELLPRVEPFYAVKCNNEEVVVKTLADLGTGFDCASKNEIAQVLSLGVSASRIIYANPCKQKSFLKYSVKHGVDLMTFDNEAELLKIKELHPKARLVLRILPTSQYKVQCELGNKFGCHPKRVERLLAKAQELDLNVMGISFHVGSGVGEAKAFSSAVEQAHDAWQTAVDMGFSMTMLDIGGGFPGQQSAPVTFPEIAKILNEALDQYFPEGCGARIIAEPGRYYVASAFTLAVNIIAKRTVARDISVADGHSEQVLTSNDEPSHMYYVNDGVYGSFNCLLYDHATVEPRVIAKSECRFTSSIWGPTCDGLDCIIEECTMPEMEVGQWIYFCDMGAYTVCAGSTFNGMPRPTIHYICSSDIMEEVYPESGMVRRRCESSSEEPEFPAILKSGHDMPGLYDALGAMPCIADEAVLA